MKVLVTGAGGFLGRALVRRAIGAGHEVCALRRPGAPAPDVPAALTICHGTLAAPPWDALARFGAQTCVHAAWITEPGVYPESTANDRYRDESASFLAGLFERGLGHTVVLGTCAEYRPSPAPLDEVRSPLDPRTRYARAKDALRATLTERAAAAGAGLAWARVFQPYGPGEHPERLCSTVVRRLAAGERVTLGRPDAVRDWIHVDDVATALLCLVESRAAMVVNVGTGEGRTVASVALALAALLGRPDLVSPPAVAPDWVGALVADPARLRGLGWAPRVTLDEGLKRLIEHLR
jgi:dTDP-6-deoxy-L-talose 4-dehydrogenase (NAD+)